MRSSKDNEFETIMCHDIGEFVRLLSELEGKYKDAGFVKEFGYVVD